MLPTSNPKSDIVNSSTSLRIGVVFVAIGIAVLALAALQAADIIAIFSASPVVAAIVLVGIGLLMIQMARSRARREAEDEA